MMFRGGWEGAERQRMDGETAAQLRETAATHGRIVTPKQLLRWHTEGLLPRPEQRHLGRGRGTVTIYPAGATAQLLALLRLHEGRRLRVGRAGFALWYNGWSVDVQFAHDALHAAAADWADSVAQLNDEGGEHGLSLKAWAVIEGWVKEPAPALRRAYRRAGRARAEALRRVLLQLAAGTFAGLNDTDREAFMAGMDFSRPSKFSPPHIGAMWLQGDLGGQLLRLQETLRPDALRAALDAATDDDLARARDELRALLGGLDDARVMIELACGGHNAGLAVTPRPKELDEGIHTALLLLWLALRRLPEAHDGLPLVLSALAPFSVTRCALDMLTPGSAGTTEKPPRLLQQSGGMAHGKEPSACTPSLPRPPDL